MILPHRSSIVPSATMVSASPKSTVGLEPRALSRRCISTVMTIFWCRLSGTNMFDCTVVKKPQSCTWATKGAVGVVQLGIVGKCLWVFVLTKRRFTLLAEFEDHKGASLLLGDDPAGYACSLDSAALR